MHGCVAQGHGLGFIGRPGSVSSMAEPNDHKDPSQNKWFHDSITGFYNRRSNEQRLKYRKIHFHKILCHMFVPEIA